MIDCRLIRKMTFITAIQGFKSMVFRLVECHDVGGVEVETTSIHKNDYRNWPLSGVMNFIGVSS